MKQKKKLIIAVLFCILAVLICNGANASAMSKKVKKAYKKKVNSVLNNGNEYTWYTYGTIEVPGSKIPLLGIETRIASDTYWMKIYTYRNGKVKKLGSGDGYGIEIYKNYLLFTYGHESLYYSAEVYKYKNGKLKLVAKSKMDDDGRHYKLYDIVIGNAMKKANLSHKNFKYINIADDWKTENGRKKSNW